MMTKEKKIDKDFKLSSWAIRNKTTIYAIMGVFFFYGISAYFSMARENFPEVKETKIYISTVYPGNTAEDIEKLITDPLEDKVKTVSNVVEVTSTSQEDYSIVIVEFDENISVEQAKQKVKDEIDTETSNEDWPTFNGAKIAPNVFNLSMSEEMPILNINISGDYPVYKLKEFAEYLQDEIEDLPEIKKADIRGAQDKEVEVAVDVYKMMAAKVSFNDITSAIGNGNITMSAGNFITSGQRRTIRIIGEIDNPSDLENFVIKSEFNNPVYLKDVAKVHFGPATRRGGLDKGGAEAVGGVVVARYGANPMEVINNVKEKINELSAGLPSKVLADGRTSQVTIIPFYDRTELIKETLGTLNEALTLEILITILVIIIMVFNLRASILISGLLPVAVLMVFIAMKLFGVDANIVALSGIAIAIGTMVDVGVILSENIIRHLDEDDGKLPINTVVYNATAEVSGAIVTAVMTTIISFIPVFTMIGAEGKLFRPLAFTKTFALTASIIVALFLIPPFAAFLFRRKSIKKNFSYIINAALILAGILGVIYGYWLGIILIGFGITGVLKLLEKLNEKRVNLVNIIISVTAIVFLLAEYWRPLGVDKSIFWNLIFVSVICFGLLAVFTLFRSYYTRILRWCLDNKLLFLSVPTAIVITGFFIMKNTGKEFMPSLNEGSFLLMPTSMPHSGVEENKRVLQQLDMAVASIPEIKMVVGKAGRTESALDPAPLSMYENIIQYKSEYMLNENGERQRYKVNDDGEYVLKNGMSLRAEQRAAWQSLNTKEQLIPDDNGEFYRNWRPEIKSPDDIWNEIVRVTKLPGVTSAPKLQPIETRLVMLQTGMRAPMGIKVKGQDLKQIEAFGIKLENIIKQAEGVKKEAVFADRIVGKPYLLIDIDREKIARYGISIQDVQDVLKVAVGGMVLTQTVEGRERYGVRVRYPRELRANPTDLKQIYIPLAKGSPIPLSELATIRYEKGPQVIKSEDTFLVGYVLFDKLDGFAEVSVVENAQTLIQQKIDSGELVVPKGINYKFTGTYENQLRAEKTLSVVVPLALVIIFLILYFQFRSVATSLMVFTGIAVAFAGGFVMIWLYGQDWFLNFNFFGENMRDLFQMHPINLSVAVWVGFIALFGIATDDGVVMATYLTQTFDRNTPENKKEIRASIVEAGEKRIRPCLMTTATTILALLPVLTSTGRGSDIMIPMAIPSFGGMLIALITLFVVPVLYSWKQEFQFKRTVK